MPASRRDRFGVGETDEVQYPSPDASITPRGRSRGKDRRCRARLGHVADLEGPATADRGAGSDPRAARRRGSRARPVPGIHSDQSAAHGRAANRPGPADRSGRRRREADGATRRLHLRHRCGPLHGEDRWCVLSADLGQAKLQLGDSGGAKAAFKKALVADSRYIRPYAPLARITIGEQDWARTLELAEVVLSVTPADAQMRWFRAVSQFELRDLDNAASSLSELHSDDAAEKQFPQSHHLLGMIYANRGEIKEAASEYRRYLELAPDASPGDGIRQQLSEWEQQGII